MYKKVLSLILALIMALGMFSFTVLAANYTISLDKTTNYYPNEEITVTVSGFTEAEPAKSPVVHVCNPSDPIGTYIDYWNIRGSGGTRTRTFRMELKEGTYEMRFFTDHDSPAYTYMTKLEFKVGNTAAPTGYTMSLNKITNYYPNEEIIVTVSGFTESQPAKSPVVHVCNPSDPIGTYIDYWNIRGSGGTRSRTFQMELKEGPYEIRFFTDHDSPAATYVTKLDFRVGGGSAAISTPVPTPTPTPTPPPVTSPPVTPTPVTPTPVTPVQPVQSAAFTTVAIDTGVKLEWAVVPGAICYRVYRSATQGAEGISITDFAITGISYVDVNVDANTTYYYSVRALMKEANAATGEREQLGSPTAQITVKTGAVILGGNVSEMGNATKNVILMKLNDPNMSVNGLMQEIDPGRGTAPQILNGRTVVPIRAIIETMGGTVGWDAATNKITLNAGGHNVEMWLDKKDLVVDGKTQIMDVAPVSINDRTMVPVRFAAENVGCVVDWIGSTGEIVIVYFTGGTPPQNAITPPVTVTPTEPDKPTEPPVTTTEPAEPSDPDDSGTPPELDSTRMGLFQLDDASSSGTGGGIRRTTIVGIWQSQYSDESARLTNIYEFRDDGTYEYEEYIMDWKDYTYKEMIPKRFRYEKGNYVVNDGIITLKDMQMYVSRSDTWAYYPNRELTRNYDYSLIGYFGLYIKQYNYHDNSYSALNTFTEMSYRPTVENVTYLDLLPRHTPPSDGTIDSAVLGSWTAVATGDIISFAQNFTFNADGTYTSMFLADSKWTGQTINETWGNFTTKKDKIYLFNMQGRQTIKNSSGTTVGSVENYANEAYNYSFGNNFWGQYSLLLRVNYWSDPVYCAKD